MPQHNLGHISIEHSGFQKAFGKQTFKKYSFQMITDFEWSVFGSPLYGTLSKHLESLDLA